MQIDNPTQEEAEQEQATRVDLDLAKKGKSLTELIALMDAYSPVIPDTVTDVFPLPSSPVLPREIRI
jgi:hypothetical protein